MAYNKITLCDLLQDKEEIDDYFRLNLGSNFKEAVCVYAKKTKQNRSVFEKLEVGESTVKATGFVKPEPENIMVYIIADKIR